MSKKLVRKETAHKNRNPLFDEIEKGEEKKEREQQMNIKVPLSTHKKLLALKSIQNKKLYEVVDAMADKTFENLSEEEKAVFNILIKSDN